MKQEVERKLFGHRGTAGFTLIEIMLVVVIIGILATVATVAVKGKSKSASIAATRMTIRAVCLAVDGFEVNCGVYPNSLDELINNPGNSTWQGPYLKGKSLPMDAWGKPLQYSRSDDDYKVWADGPDGRIESQ